MPLLVVALLVAAVHLPIAWGAWTGVGFLADDHEMVGVAVYQHRGVISLWDSFRPVLPPDAPVALYRPILGLLFWLEQPWFGGAPTGYHVVNSLLHCATAIVWSLLMRRWTGSTVAGLATALLFTAWPGHGEALHWVAARVNLLSTCLFSCALLAHDAGCARAGSARWWRFAIAALLAAIAAGAKESAVLVGPAAFAVAWGRAAGAPIGTRLRRAIGWSAPMAAALALFLAWRAHVLGTWGSGTEYGWRAARVGWQTFGDWLGALVAPAHADCAPDWLAVAVGGVTVVLLAHALAALRAAPARAAAGPAALLLALGVAAGVGLAPIVPTTLQNARYLYEPALGLCALLGLGVAALPARVLGPSLAVALVVFHLGLAENRAPWLRVGAAIQHARQQAEGLAAATGQPLALVDAPAILDGAYGVLNGQTQFAFWQAMAPAGVALRGSLRSDQQWRETLADFAAAATAGALATPTWSVRWHDGELVPVALAPQWPARVADGVEIGYARLGRCEAYVGDAVPAHVLLRTDRPVTLQALATVGDFTWAGAVVAVAAGAAPQPISVSVPPPATALAGRSIAVELLVVFADGSGRFALGTTRAVAR
ncbi:MAG: hypothetical protein ACK6D2_19315 [Planctomycetota bacterium]